MCSHWAHWQCLLGVWLCGLIVRQTSFIQWEKLVVVVWFLYLIGWFVVLFHQQQAHSQGRPNLSFPCGQLKIDSSTKELEARWWVPFRASLDFTMSLWHKRKGKHRTTYYTKGNVSEGPVTYFFLACVPSPPKHPSPSTPTWMRLLS